MHGRSQRLAELPAWRRSAREVARGGAPACNPVRLPHPMAGHARGPDVSFFQRPHSAAQRYCSCLCVQGSSAALLNDIHTVVMWGTPGGTMLRLPEAAK